MGLLARLGLKKSHGSVAARRQRAGELHGQAIKYVTERIDDNDTVVGRGGSISVRNGQLLLFTSDKILMRAEVDSLDASYLLSGDGVVLTAPNLEQQGAVCRYVAYFVYYRK